MKRDKETNRVVHLSEIDTLAKLGDLYIRMARKLKNRFGRSSPYVVEERTVRLACCWRSARNAVIVTLRLVDGDEYPELPSDGAIYEAKQKGIVLWPASLKKIS